MRYLITFILSLTALTAFSQGAVDRIELGYQTTRRGIVWVRPGLPTHEPAWRISRDTNSIMWHNLTTGIRYDWSYDAGVWYTRDFIASTLPPLDVFTSGAATIDNTQATWINDDGVLHHYSQAEGAWLPDKISFQSAGPTDIAAGVSNGAAVYTTSLWQDSDTYLVYYWDGDSWELLSGSGTNLTYTGTSSPVTLNSSTGTDVTVTAGTGVSLSATSTNMTITNSAPDQTVSIINGGGVSVSGTYPNFTLTATDQSATNEAQTLSVSGTTSGVISLNAISGVGGGTATIAAGTGVDVAQSGGTITISQTTSGLSKWTDAGAYTYLTATGDRVLIGSSSELNSSYLFQSNGSAIFNGNIAIPTTTSTVGSILVNGQRAAHFYNSGTFLGIQAGNYTMSGIDNTGIGRSALKSVTSGHSNSAFGRSAGEFITTGYENTAFSRYALGSCTSGSQNVAIGNTAMYGNLTGQGCTAIGYDALRNPTGPNYTTAIGYMAMKSAGASASNNTAVGASAGYNAAGTGNVFIGYNSGFFETGSNTLYIDNSNTSSPLISGDFSSNQVGINTSVSSISRTLHVTGEVRITDLTTDPPTRIVGADADGDLGELALSGLSISSGTLTATDASATNELQTISVSANTTTLSNSGGSMTIAGGGINTVGTAGTTITITGTEVDGSISNEGSLTVGAGTGTTSIINSNTSGSTGVTLTAGTGLSISETGNVITLTNSAPDQTVSITGAGINAVTGTYPNFTITGTEVDGSVTNEAQTLSVSGTTSGILTLSTAGGAGGGTATIAAGTGITVGQSGGTITITNASPGTAGWLLDGNTIGAAKRIGSNDNFDVVVETNNTDRMWFDNAGTVSIGATQLTTAQFNINGFGTTGGTGMLIAGGASLTGPTFYSATGSGSGSNATVLSGVVNMLNGNVEALLQNSATTGTGGALLTLNTHQSATGDPKVYWTTNGTTDWAAGIDNSISGEPWKLTANSDIGAATPAISATTANKVGVNQAAASVTLQVTGTDAVGLPSGTIAQRSAAAIPQIRHNNTFSGFEFYDPNKNYWYRLTCVSSPTVATSAAAGTGATAGLVSGAGSNDVRGAIELTTGSASLAVGTVVNVTYSNPYSGTATNVILTPKNDAATTESNKWRVENETQNGFSIRAVTALTASTTYQFNYSIGQ